MGMELIIQIIAGLLAATLPVRGLKNLSLGTLAIRSPVPSAAALAACLMGMLGGAAAQLRMRPADLDIGAIIQSVAGGGVGGAMLTAIVGMVKKALVQVTDVSGAGRSRRVRPRPSCRACAARAAISG